MLERDMQIFRPECKNMHLWMQKLHTSECKNILHLPFCHFSTSITHLTMGENDKKYHSTLLQDSKKKMCSNCHVTTAVPLPYLLNLLASWKKPERQQPKAGQEDSFVSFRKEQAKHCTNRAHFYNWCRLTSGFSIESSLWGFGFGVFGWLVGWLFSNPKMRSIHWLLYSFNTCSNSIGLVGY